MSQIDRTGKRARKVTRQINAATAAEAVGPIRPDMEIYGLSKGQFSLIELLEHVLDATGPADVTISTWTAAGADLAHAQTLLNDGRILSCRWLVDFSFPSRQPAYAAQLRARFGDEAIRCTANHAKFVMVRNERWNVTIRTSMNLNLNRRLESYEISEDAALCDWLTEVTEMMFADDGASTIGAATKSAYAAKTSLSDIGGTVTFAQPMEFGGTGRGISFD